MKILNTLAISAIAATAFTTVALAQTSVTIQSGPILSSPAVTTTTTTDQNGNVISSTTQPTMVYGSNTQQTFTRTQTYSQPLWNYEAHDDRNVPDSSYTGN